MKRGRFGLFAVIVMMAVFSFVLMQSPPLFAQAAPWAQGKERKQAKTSDYAALKSAAETLYAEGNYTEAASEYEKALKLAPKADERWIRFRLADSTWRGLSAESKEPRSSQGMASSKMVWARQTLEKLIEPRGTSERADVISAECQESLGDFWAQPSPYFNWNMASSYYHPALDWWAGSTDIATARMRYLEIAFKCARPFEAGVDGLPGNGAGPVLSLSEAQGALKIALTGEEKTHAQFLVALALMQSDDPSASHQVADAFEASLASRKQSPWYAAALYWFAFWSTGQGAAARKAGADCSQAVVLFKRICQEFSEKETPFSAKAKRWLDAHARNPLQLAVSSNFLPGVLPGFDLRFLRQRKVKFALYPVNLAQARLRQNSGAAKPPDDNWTQAFDLRGVRPIKTWEKEFSGDASCDFVSEHINMDWAPPTGAYVLEATGTAGSRATEILLVTGTALVVKRSGAQVIVLACDATDGVPVAGARVRLLDAMEGAWHAEAVADEDGLARFHLPQAESGSDLIALSSLGPRQAFAITRPAAQPSTEGAPIFDIITDRPAYRPGEKVQWKVTIRREAGKGLATPAGERFAYLIIGPQENKAKEGLLTLNSYGSAWDDLTLDAQSPLGEYHIEFHQVLEEDQRQIQGDESPKQEEQEVSGEKIEPVALGEATLFRLEEYKLPEFKVAVQTSEDGLPKVFRPTETVVAAIQANYYSGEPVAQAKVDVVVYQRPYARPHRAEEGIPWMNEVQPQDDFNLPNGQIVRRETLTADEEGHVQYSFQPQDSAGDMEYRIEVRVTDASRRMASGEGRALVSRRTSYADLSTGGTVFRVGESLTVHVRSTDAYGHPRSSKGTLALSRTETREIWLDPAGKRVEGGALRKAKALYPKFPPPPKKKGEKGWTFYTKYPEEVKVQSKQVAVGPSGETAVVFSLAKEGPYQIKWLDERGNEGGADERVSLLVVGNEAKPLLLASGAFQVILSRSQVKPGEPARALIVSPFVKAHILVGMDGDTLHGVHVIGLSGTTAVVDIDTGDGDSPCAYFSADMVKDLKLYSVTQKIDVPALSHSLSVRLTPSREEYLPRQAGTWTIKTLDAAGRPVQAEVSLGVVDDSVYSLQSEYARDPRSVFLTWQRFPQAVTTGAFDRSYLKPPPKPVPVAEGGRAIAFNGTGIKGRITDLSGQPISGATVKGSGPGFSGLAMTATDADGIFTLDMPAGKNYVLQVDAAGYNSVVRSGIEVVEGKATYMPFQLGSGSSTITVVGAAPIIDAKKTETGATITDALQGGVEGGVFGGVLGGSLRGPENAYLAPSVAAEAIPPAQPESAFPVIVRHNFSATALWRPDLITDANGSASIQIGYPESLTLWRATARAATTGSDFGVARSNVRTHQDLTVRLQCPRFLVTGDVATISALIQNSGEHALTVAAILKAEGVALQGAQAKQEGVRVPAKGSTRVDWRVTASESGDASFEVQASGARASDAMSRTIPVLPHGLEVSEGATGSSPEGDVILHLSLPSRRASNSTSLEIQVSLGPATAALDALPYLMGYPYGCTEQTMSRFLPCVVAARVLKERGMSPEEAARRILGPAPDKPGAGPAGEKSSSLKNLADMTDKGLARLYGFHHPDGGWGWWENDASDPFMTAYVLDGLCTARASGIEVPDDVLRQAQEFLMARLLKESQDGGLMAWMLYAVASSHAQLSGGENQEPPPGSLDALKTLWNQRALLTSYGQALLALSAGYLGRGDWAKGLAHDLEKTAISEHVEGGMRLVFWGKQGSWWHWSLGPTETTAFVVRALLATDPKNPLIYPAVAWLLAHRTGPQWSNTRDTALAVLALNDYIIHTHERPSFGRLDIQVNGHLAKRLEITGEASALDGNLFRVDPSLLRDGENEIVAKRKSGGGQLFVSALARFYSQEEPVKSAQAGLAVARQYTLLRRVPTLLKGDIIVRQIVNNGDVVSSGDRIECRLTLKGDQETDYILLEDDKPAGLEPVDIRSGGRVVASKVDGGSQPLEAYEELRDTKTAFFIAHLPAGSWEIRYEMYAQTPGVFHAMPAQAQAMYAPHIKGNSDEMRLTVR